MDARPASTLILLRAAAAPLEVLMIKRAAELFGGGWWVFPGGAVDDADRHPDAAPLLSGVEDAEARPWILAALRETAEEVGLCLSRPPIDPAVLDRSNIGRTLTEQGAAFDGAAVAYLSNWITPLEVPKRFDTRFFVAEWPHPIDPVPDGAEVVDCAWVAPASMLDRDRDAYPLIFPTIKHLELLAEFSSPQAVLTHARTTPVEPILPRPIDGGGFRRLLLPGDPGYAEAGP